MVKENRLQYEIVKWYSENYQKNKGCLFSVRNTTFSKKDGMTQKAMGMYAGVSDLILIHANRTIAIELKEKGSKHDKHHVERQLEWGETVENLGDWIYCIVTTLEEFQLLVRALIYPPIGTLELRKKIEESGSKIQF